MNPRLVLTRTFTWTQLICAILLHAIFARGATVANVDTVLRRLVAANPGDYSACRNNMVFSKGAYKYCGMGLAVRCSNWPSGYAVDLPSVGPSVAFCVQSECSAADLSSNVTALLHWANQYSSRIGVSIPQIIAKFSLQCNATSAMSEDDVEAAGGRLRPGSREDETLQEGDAGGFEGPSDPGPSLNLLYVRVPLTVFSSISLPVEDDGIPLFPAARAATALGTAVDADTGMELVAVGVQCETYDGPRGGVGSPASTPSGLAVVLVVCTVAVLAVVCAALRALPSSLQQLRGHKPSGHGGTVNADQSATVPLLPPSSTSSQSSGAGRPAPVPPLFVYPRVVDSLLSVFDFKESMKKLLSSSRSMARVPAAAATSSENAPQIGWKCDTAMLDGLRVLSMFWVISGHTVVFPAGLPGYSNAGEVFDLSQTFPFFLVSSAVLAVDTFFFLSAFLNALLFCRNVARQKRFPRVLDLIWLIIHRYLRLAIPVAAMIVVALYIIPRSGGGPFAGTNGLLTITKTCKKTWWQNVLLINNVSPWNVKNACVDWVWYVANDFQFFLVSPIFFALWFLVSPYVSLAALAASLTVSIGLATHYGFGVDYYFHPWFRISPYLWGLVCGLLAGDIEVSLSLRSSQPSYGEITECPPKIRISSSVGHRLSVIANWRVLRVVMFLVAAGLMSGCVVSQWKYTANEIGNSINSIAPTLGKPVVNTHFTHFNGFLYNFGWGLGLLCFVLAGVYSNPGFILSFLCHPFWVPMGKLTFGAYLLHPLLMYLFGGWAAVPIYFSWTWYFFMSCSFITAAYLAAVLWWILLESPTTGLVAMAMKRAASAKTK